MVTEARETGSLIGSDKVEGTARRRYLKRKKARLTAGLFSYFAASSGDLRNRQVANGR